MSCKINERAHGNKDIFLLRKILLENFLSGQLGQILLYVLNLDPNLLNL